MTEAIRGPKDCSLLDLIGLHDLQLMAEACHKACGVAVSIKEADNEDVLVAAGWQDICARYHRVHPVSRQRCIQSRANLCTPGVRPAVQDLLCHNGMRHLSFPMQVEGRHVATYYLTQFLYDTDRRDPEFFTAQALELGFDVAGYLAALAQVPVLNRQRVTDIIFYMGAFSRLITDLATRNLRLKMALEENERIQARLRETTALTESILNVIASPLFLKDRNGVYTGCNDAFCAFLERPREELIGKGVQEIYPEVEARKYAEMDKALVATGGVQTYEFRMTRKDGSVRDVIFSKAATLDASGEVIGIVGVITDITERNMAAKALRQSQERYRFLAENSADIIWRLDAEHRFVYASPADERLRGFPYTEVLGQSLWDAVHPDHVGLLRQRCKDYLASFLHTQDPGPMRVEVPVVVKGGGSLWVEILCNPVREQDGAVSGHHLVARDITLRKSYEEKLVFMSTHDALTGLFNRAHFEAEFNRTAHGRVLPVSVIMADVDGLKAVNDQKGHAAGDELIKAAADILRKSFRAGDLVARLGGDEFAVLLSGADEGIVAESMSRICAEIGACRLNRDENAPRLSMGAATARSPEELEHLLRLADQRMYENKTAHKTGQL